MASEYTSAEWVVFPTGERVIKALGDDGVTYWVPEADTDVPPWPDFLKTQGLKAVKDAAKPTPVKKAKETRK